MWQSEVMEIFDLGRKDYEEVWSLQHKLFNQMVNEKKDKGYVEREYLILVEHYPVITLGKHAKKENILFPDSMLKEKGIGVFNIERGGDVTYHAPGQLVVYPLIDLERYRLGVKAYVDLLEETIIRLLSQFGIIGKRIEGASGVWIETFNSDEKKICALGVKCSRYCTMHGLALNVNNDLSGFNMINPCGFTDRGVTSIAVETGREINFDEVKKRFVSVFLSLLEPRIHVPGTF